MQIECDECFRNEGRWLIGWLYVQRLQLHPIGPSHQSLGKRAWFPECVSATQFSGMDHGQNKQQLK